VEVKGRKRLYFVAETKPSQLMPELRPKEEAKIACGRRHFETLSDQMPEPIRFGTYSDPEQFVGDVADEG